MTTNHGIRMSLAALALFGLLAVGACKTSKPGVKYVAGSYQQRFAAAPPQLVDAARAVVEDMKLILIDSEATELDGKVVARTAQDRKVNISVESEGPDVSLVSVRVGTLGDEEISQMILDKIKEKLGE